MAKFGSILAKNGSFRVFRVFLTKVKPSFSTPETRLHEKIVNSNEQISIKMTKTSVLAIFG